jgi:hypothetical protein
VSALREAALGYGSRRRPVFPVDLAKKPLTKHGFQDATTDERKIGRWWTEHPEAGIATPTGPNWFVLDDDTNGRAIAELEAAYGPLPPTVEVATPRPGRHLYFIGQASNSDRALPAGLDVRGRGGYVVLPPSPHRDGTYEWKTAPDEMPIARAPAWLLELLTSPQNSAGGSEHENPVQHVPHGRRHPYLKDFALRLVRAGFTDRQLIVSHLQLEFERVCEPLPPPRAGYFDKLAAWAVDSRIAARERARTIAGVAERIRERRQEERR